MARILVATWPFGGHLLPHIEIGRELRSRGHEVAFYCSSTVLPELHRQGFRVFPYVRLDDSQFHTALVERQKKLSWFRPLRAMKMCGSWVLDSVPMQAADLEEIIEKWCPEVLVSDEFIWGCTLIMAEKHHLPLAVCSTFGGCMLPGWDAPQFGLGLGPMRGYAGRFVQKGIESATSLIARTARARANEYRREHGLTPLKGPLRANAGRAAAYLARGAPQFDYERRDLPDTVHYVGALAWSGEEDEMEPAWMSGLSRQRDPVVYISEGTLQAGLPVLLQAAVNGLGGQPVQVVMTGGNCPEARKIAAAALPPNIRFEEWIPEKHLLSHASVVVSVGGAGTILGALAAGVPILVVPQESDQPDNAGRVVRAGAGLSLPRSRCTPYNLRKAVARLLTEPAFRMNAQRIQRIFSQYPSRELAGNLIEALVPVGVA
jgi:MGT family glycosyltransferase